MTPIWCSVRSYTIHDAKTPLPRLIEWAAQGEGFVIAKAGKPMVKIVALGTPEPARARRIGFLAGQTKVPEDFNAMSAAAIRAQFEDLT